jgi:hypothetical protein
MRKFVLLSAAVVVAVVAAMLVPSSASADGTTVITIGPGQYSVGYIHPTGTVTVSGGTISARCTGQSAVGSATYSTPQCATHATACPASANYCSVVGNFQENALRGQAGFFGITFINNGTYSNYTVQKYNCPAAYSCVWRWTADLTAGTVVSSEIFNYENNSFPNVFLQTTLTVH